MKGKVARHAVRWMGLGLAMFWAVPSYAQVAAPPDQEAAVQAGIAALEASRTEEAIEAFERVFEQEPAYVSATQGAVGYWLGRAYDAEGDTESAHDVWREGLIGLAEVNRFDSRLADAFVRQVFERALHTEYLLAAEAYLGLLAAADHAGPQAATLLRAHLQELAIILPATVAQQTGVDHVVQQGMGALQPGTGQMLVAWWRSRDVAPATRTNERLEEHLRRVAYARAHYWDENEFDDRGVVYIRLGVPSHTTAIDFEDNRFRQKVVDRSLTLNTSDFPENEFWFYEHIGEAAQYLFVKRGSTFHLGETEDLLPPAVRNGMGNSSRGRNKAQAAVRTMHEVLRQLALFHPGFATRYQTVSAFTDQLDEAEMAAQATGAFERNNEAAQAAEDTPAAVKEAIASSSGPDHAGTFLTGTAFPVNRPDLFASSFLSRSYVEDQEMSLRRAETIPNDYSNAFDAVDPLPVIARHARFLDPDGTTRTEVYWGVPVGGMQPSKQMREQLRDAAIEIGDYVLLGTLVQKEAGYRERLVGYRQHVLPDLGEASDAALAPHAYTVKGDTGTFHLALQWDQYTATLDQNNQPVGLGLRVKATTYRADTLRALSSDEQVLEMSDLKPMAVLNPDQAAEAEAMIQAAVLYPFSTIQPTTPLVLYFEIYHLTFDADDRTRYTMEYEMTRRADGGLFRRDKENRIAAATEYTGSSRTATEHILLDLATWEGTGTLDITVRITDTVTGRQVERSLPFTLVEP